MRPRVLVIDNYDSFVYNLVQYLGELGSDPHRAIGMMPCHLMRSLPWTPTPS